MQNCIQNNAQFQCKELHITWNVCIPSGRQLFEMLGKITTYFICLFVCFFVCFFLSFFWIIT